MILLPSIDLSVIIPAARSRLLGQIMHQLRTQSSDMTRVEVIIVYNQDEPKTVTKAVRTYFLPVDRTTNAPSRRNAGMEIARGKVFLFLDDDCLPYSDLLERHLYRHNQGENIVGGAVTFANNNYFQLSDNVSAFHDLLPFTTAGVRPYLATANMSVNRSVVDYSGMMQPNLDRADDLEWTVRFRREGYRLYFDPQAIVVHDPPRNSLRTVWHHWVSDAPDTIRVRLQNAQLLGTPHLAHYRHAFLWGAPIIATWATTRTFRHSETRRQFWHTLPLVFLTKLLWCLSAFIYFPTDKNHSIE